MPTSIQRRYVFEPFEVDFATAELRRRGIRVKLSGQPLQVLEMLIAHPGQVVSREDLRSRLWKDDTFVDFERGLNAAVNRLREALGDSAANPSYVETLPRLGYRFIAPVSPPEPVAEFPAPAVIESVPPAVPSTTAHRPRWPFVVLLAVLLTGLLIGGLRFYKSRRQTHLLAGSKLTVLLADFRNTTGQPVFDDALRQGLFVGLEQSPYLHIVSDRQAAIILQQMGRPPGAPVAGATSVELCQRSGGNVVVEGSIAPIGSAYLVNLTGTRCDTGEAMVHEQATARSKEGVIAALDNATRQMRSRLGESLQSLQQHDVPLEQATTSSLEALKAYSNGFIVWNKDGELPAIPFFLRAVALDPNFAMAYGQLAAAYQNVGEIRAAAENATKAYALRGRVGALERMLIESWYDIYVTGDAEQALAVSEVAEQTYPGNGRLLNDLGSLRGQLGHFDRALAPLRSSIAVDPAEGNYSNLAIVQVSLGQTDQARATLQQAANKNLVSADLLQVNYWLAFLDKDADRMQSAVDRAVAVPGAQALLLFEQSDSEAFYGHFAKAHQLSLAAARLQQQADPESAGALLAEAAVREAEMQEFSSARQLAAQALKLTHDRTVTTLAAVALARIGDTRQALALARTLDTQYPLNTFTQKYWLPLIRAQLALGRHDGAGALQLLSTTQALDAASPPELPMSTLYPAYVRGEAYLMTGESAKAAAEFQKLIDHPGMVLNFPLGSLARLGLARAYAQTPDNARAEEAYRNFFRLWKTADPGMPLLLRARSEQRAVGAGK